MSDAKTLFIGVHKKLSTIIKLAKEHNLTKSDKEPWTAAKYNNTCKLYKDLLEKHNNGTMTMVEATEIERIVDLLDGELKGALFDGKGKEEENEEERGTYMVSAKEAGTLITTWRGYAKNWSQVQHLGDHGKSAILNFQKAVNEIKHMFHGVDQEDPVKKDIYAQIAHVENIEKLYDEYVQASSKRKRDNENSSEKSRSKCESCDKIRVLVEDADGELHQCKQCFTQDCARSSYEMMDTRFNLLPEKEQDERIDVWNDFTDFIQSIIDENSTLKFDDALGGQIDEWTRKLNDILPEEDADFDEPLSSDEPSAEFSEPMEEDDDDDDDNSVVLPARIEEQQPVVDDDGSLFHRVGRLEQAVFGGDTSYYSIMKRKASDGETHLLVENRYKTLKKARLAFGKEQTDPETTSTILFITEIK